MKKKDTRSIEFFNASSLLEELSENEMFQLKGGTSEPSQPTDPDPPYEELPEVVVIGHPNEDDGGEEDPGYDPGDDDTDPDDGDDWDDDEDNDPTDDPGWDDDGTGDGADDGTPPDTSSDNNDGPWLRDAQGHLITTDTGRTSQADYTNYTINFKEVTIKTANGTTITAFEVTSVIDKSTGQPLSSIPSNFASNCTGFAFAGGDVWIFDPQQSSANEEAAFDSMLNNNNLFTQVTKDQADVAVIWWTDTSTGEKFIAHSAEVNDDGTFNQKSDYGSVQHNVSESDFTNGHTPTGGLYTMEIDYYKRNY